MPENRLSSDLDHRLGFKMCLFGKTRSETASEDDAFHIILFISIPESKNSFKRSDFVETVILPSTKGFSTLQRHLSRNPILLTLLQSSQPLRVVIKTIYYILNSHLRNYFFRKNDIRLVHHNGGIWVDKLYDSYT